MVVKEGYKNTEVGVIPEDWECVSMGEVGETIIGLTYSPNDVKDYGLLVLRSSNVQQNQLKYENNVFVDMVVPKRVIVKQNDILICVRNGSKQLIGKCALIDKKAEGLAFGAFMSIYRSQFSKYIYYSFQSNIIQRQIDETMGATINQLTNKNLAEFKIPLPPLPEQTAIATVLSDTDNLIQTLEKKIAKKELIKKGAMQELLEPKEGWEVKRLGEICDYQNGTALERFFNNQGGLKVVSIGNYSPKGKFVTTNSYISLNHKSSISKYILNKGELTMILNDKTSVGTIIGRVLLIDKNNEYVFNQRTMRLKPKENISSLFLYFLINSDLIHNKIVKLAKPGTQIYVNTDDITQLELEIPISIEEQSQIAQILSDMDTEIESLQEKLSKYKQLKQGLMQELLTGKIRLV